MKIDISVRFKEASDSLYEAMALYIKLLEVNSSLMNDEIETEYKDNISKYMRLNDSYKKLGIVTNKNSAELLRANKDNLLAQIQEKVNSSILNTIEILSISMKDKSDYGVQLSRMMLENNIKFINMSKDAISISLIGSRDFIIIAENAFLKSSYKDNVMLQQAFVKLKEKI